MCCRGKALCTHTGCSVDWRRTRSRTARSFLPCVMVDIEYVLLLPDDPVKHSPQAPRSTHLMAFTSQCCNTVCPLRYMFLLPCVSWWRATIVMRIVVTGYYCHAYRGDGLLLPCVSWWRATIAMRIVVTGYYCHAYRGDGLLLPCVSWWRATIAMRIVVTGYYCHAYRGDGLLLPSQFCTNVRICSLPQYCRYLSST